MLGLGEDFRNRLLTTCKRSLDNSFYGLYRLISRLPVLRARWRISWTVTLAGFAVIVIGVLCLCLSALVAAPASWWQGTLDAFGVGFVVGGVIDVLAIFGIERVVSHATQRGTSADQEAKEILETNPEPHTWELYYQLMCARDLLNEKWGVLDPELRHRLRRFTDEADKALLDDEGPGHIPRYRMTGPKRDLDQAP
jgi:hypothetical protein